MTLLAIAASTFGSDAAAKGTGVDMQWFVDHAEQIFAAIGAVGIAARLIVALTPTKHDDAALAKLMQFLAVFYRGPKK